MKDLKEAVGNLATSPGPLQDVAGLVVRMKVDLLATEVGAALKRVSGRQDLVL